MRLMLLKRIAGALVITAVAVLFIVIAAVMYGHKCYHELMAEFLASNCCFSYVKTSASMFHEDGYLSYTVGMDEDEKKEKEFIFKVSSIFMLGRVYTTVTYLNGPYDPVFQEIFNIRNNEGFKINIDYFNHRLKGGLKINELSVDETRLFLELDDLNVELRHRNGKFEFFTKLKSAVLNLPGTEIKIRNIVTDSFHLKFARADIRHYYDTHTRVDIKLSDAKITRQDPLYWYFHSDYMMLSLYDAAENKGLVDRVEFNGTNADLKLDLLQLFTGYDFFYYSPESLLSYLAGFPVKIYINGGQDQNNQTFDIVYDSLTKNRMQQKNESMLRLFLGFRLFNILNLYTVPELVDADPDNVTLKLRDFKLYGTEKR